MAGLLSGLAQGIEAGQAQQLRQNEQQLEARRLGLQEQEASQAQAARLSAADRQRAQDALGALEAQRGALAQQASLEAPEAFADTGVRKHYADQFSAISKRQQEILSHLGGADAVQFARGAEQHGEDLATGKKSIADLSPEELTHFTVYHTGFGPSDLIDTRGETPTKSYVGAAFDQLHQGLKSMGQDNGAQVLSAVNKLAGNDLAHLVGQTAADGSTISGAEFAPPVPHPGSPDHVLLTAKLTLKRPDGATTEQYVPILDDHGQIAAHPDDSSQATVKNFKLDDLFNHLGALETFYHAANSDPETRDKLLQGYTDGHEDYAQEQLRTIRRFGGDPTKLLPRGKLVLDLEGKPLYEAAPGQETQFLPQGLAVQQLKGDNALERAQIQAQNALALAAFKSANTQNTENWQPTGFVDQATGAPLLAETRSGRTKAIEGAIPKPAAAGARSAEMLVMQRYLDEHPQADSSDLSEFVGNFRSGVAARKAFDVGRPADAVRFGDNALTHLSTVKSMIAALNNGNIQLFNKLGNSIGVASGTTPAVALQAAASIVGPEVEKAIISTGGSAGERTEAKDLLNASQSPAQLQAVLNTQAGLLGEQLYGSAKQYSRTVKKQDLNPDEFAKEFQLRPDAIAALHHASANEARNRAAGVGGTTPKPALGAGSQPSGGATLPPKSFSLADVRAIAAQRKIDPDKFAESLRAQGHKVE